MADPYNVLFILPLQVNKKYMKAIEMIRVALQYYEVKDKTESIRYTYKGEISPCRIHINNWKNTKQK